jgi:CDP-4-dehydro-6-deoxyglucose reductase
MEARLIESIEIAPGVRHFVFEAPEAGKVEFIPGQFVSLTGMVNGKRITRAYSIASAPSGTNRFDLCLNLVPGGVFSPYLFQMKPGDSVEMQQPLGQFVLRNPPRDSILVATGTGIAPFRSMLQTYLSATSPSFTLLFGVRYEHNLMYRGEFEDMARRFPHFRFWPTLTRPGPDWTGRTGRVQAHLREAIGERRDLDVFLCGLKLMVNEVRNLVKEMGFDRKQIFYEKYD